MTPECYAMHVTWRSGSGFRLARCHEDSGYPRPAAGVSAELMEQVVLHIAVELHAVNVVTGFLVGGGAELGGRLIAAVLE